MKLSTRSRYGTRMLLDIALYGHDSPVRIKDVSQRQGVSVKYLEKLIRPLKKANYIKSKRGPRGGHMLGKPAGDISVGEVVRLLEGDVSLVKCTTNGSLCKRSPSCLTRKLWKDAGMAMLEKLDAVTIHDLVQDARTADAEQPGCPG